ncbi:MAG: hypothetical protein ACRC6I_19180, partial [Paracoccaceae bacterium]
MMDEPGAIYQFIWFVHPLSLIGLAGVALLPWPYAPRFGLAVLLVGLAAMLAVPELPLFGLERVMIDQPSGWAVAILLGIGVFVRAQASRAVAGPAWLRHVDMALGAAYGVVLAGGLFWRGAWHLAGDDRGLRWHAGLVVLALGVGVLGYRAGRRDWRVGAGVFSVMLLGLAGWSGLIYPGKVRATAAAMADGAPYCIYEDGELGPVSADIDMSFLTLPKLSPGQFASRMFEGESPWLVVERAGRFYEDRQTSAPFQRLYWSQDEAAFVLPEDYDDPVRAFVSCIPQADGLPVAGADGAGEVYLYGIGRDDEPGDGNLPSVWHTQKLRIDPAFRPTTQAPYVYFRAMAPDFAPAPVTDAGTNQDVVLFEIRGDIFSQNKVNRVIPEGIDMQDMPADAGLHRYEDAEGHAWYAAFAPNGEIRTAIDCSA